MYIVFFLYSAYYNHRNKLCNGAFEQSLNALFYYEEDIL